jgi:hypothetical protein
MMSHEQDFGPTASAKEREALALLADRLERGCPVPNAGFRGELRRLLLTAPRRSASPSVRWRLWAASYAGAGAVCLAVAAIGLAGGGPFAA